MYIMDRYKQLELIFFIKFLKEFDIKIENEGITHLKNTMEGYSYDYMCVRYITSLESTQHSYFYHIEGKIKRFLDCLWNYYVLYHLKYNLIKCDKIETLVASLKYNDRDVFRTCEKVFHSILNAFNPITLNQCIIKELIQCPYKCDKSFMKHLQLK